MLYVGDLAEQTDLGLRSILGIRSGRLANFFSTIMLLWAGQLALLIYWYRRKSPTDFHGRYRLWLWIGVTLQFFLAVVATEAHRPFGEYMQRMWPLDVPQYPLLSWLVPVSTIGLAMFKLMLMETRNSTCSRILLWIAGVAALVAGVSLVMGAWLAPRTGDLIQVGSATLAHMGVATALLFHARYVIHVSNAAPKSSRKASLTRRTWQWAVGLLRLDTFSFRLPRLRMPRLRWPERQPRKARPAKEKAPKPAADSKRKSKPLPKPQPKQDVEVRGKEEAAPAQQSASSPSGQKLRIDEAEALKGPKGPARSGADELAERIARGEAIDDATLNQLNKKERRRLKKLQQSAGSAH